MTLRLPNEKIAYLRDDAEMTAEELGDDLDSGGRLRLAYEKFPFERTFNSMLQFVKTPTDLNAQRALSRKILNLAPFHPIKELLDSVGRSVGVTYRSDLQENARLEVYSEFDGGDVEEFQSGLGKSMLSLMRSSDKSTGHAWRIFSEARTVMSRSLQDIRAKMTLPSGSNLSYTLDRDLQPTSLAIEQSTFDKAISQGQLALESLMAAYSWAVLNDEGKRKNNFLTACDQQLLKKVQVHPNPASSQGGR